MGEEVHSLRNAAAPGSYEGELSRTVGGVPQRPIIEAVAAKYGQTVEQRADVVEPMSNAQYDLFAVTEPIRQWHRDQILATTTYAELDAAWAAFMAELDATLPV